MGNAFFSPLKKNQKNIQNQGHIPSPLGIKAVNEPNMKDYNTELVALATTDGFSVTNMGNILCCIADGSYTTICLSDNSSYKLSKRLSQVASQLPDDLFLRTHHHFLVNKYHVRYFVKNGSFKMQLSNGRWIPIAERRRKEVLEKFRIM
jgi:DNA-binding LytR/AlgR family response regulator